MDPDTRVQPEPREDVTTPPVQGGMHMTTTTAAMHLPTASPEYTEQLTTDQPMEDVRHKANSLVHAPDSNPWPHDNSCFGDISPMHDGPEVIPSPAPPNGSTVVPRECVRERDVSLGAFFHFLNVVPSH